MSRNRLLALAAATATLAGCTPTPTTSPEPTPTAELGTVEPAYPVGTGLNLGIEVLASIPVDDLSTSEPAALDTAHPCSSVPAAVVTPAGLDPEPVLDDVHGCAWRGSGLGLEIGIDTKPMAATVAEHRDMSTGRSADRLEHLAWLRIDDHYAIERILSLDRTKSCWLSLDVSTSVSVHAALFRADPATGEPTESDTPASVRELCPLARLVTKNLLDHIDEVRPSWLERHGSPIG